MTSLKSVLIDQIIEIAVVLTDNDLNIVAEGPDIVIHADPALFERDLFVKGFHEKSGMLQASVESNTSMQEAEYAVLGFLKQHVAENSSPLCGNSIHADRHFLRMQMPFVENYLHYRCIDVSTLKELSKRWNPEVYAGAEKLKEIKIHRAKDDILKSIEELKFYRTNFLKQA